MCYTIKNEQKRTLKNLEVAMVFDDNKLKEIYYFMVLSREYENRANELFKNKEFTEKPFSGIGQEAVSVGAVIPLEEKDYIAPTLRSKGAFLAKGITVKDCFLQLYRKGNSASKGLWTAHHMGDMEKGVILTSALVASALPVAAGIAMSSKLRHTGQVVVAYVGDGGTSRGDFHSAVNVAAVHDLPIVFVVENNLYALSTHISEQMKNPNIADRAIGYGISGATVDGQDVIKVIDAVDEAVQRARNGQGPSIIDCKTYRFRGHAESHDELDGRPLDEFDQWRQRCPIKIFEKYIKENSNISEDELLKIRESVIKEIDEAVEFAKNSPDPVIDDTEKLVYA